MRSEREECAETDRLKAETETDRLKAETETGTLEGGTQEGRDRQGATWATCS